MRQYVGARYVPVFYNNPNGGWDWAQGKEYEPLIIVKYGLNTYTSKKKVPAEVGAPDMNPEFWALTGNYNGAINELQTDLSFVKGIVSNRSIMAIGDSYSKVSQPGWMELMCNYLNIPSANRYLYGYPGYGFAEGGFLNALNLLRPSVKKPKELQQIIVAGGYNDVNYIKANPNGLTTLVAKMQEFRNACKTYFPNARVYIAFLGWQTPSVEASKNNNSALLNVYNFYRSFNQSLMTYVTGSEYILHSPDYLNIRDGSHPTEIASSIIAAYFASFLNGGREHIYYKKLVSALGINGIMPPQLSMYFEVNDNVTRLVGYDRALKLFNFNYVNGQPLLKFTDWNCFFPGNNQCKIYTHVIVTKPDSSVSVEGCELLLDNNSLYMDLALPNGTYTLEFYDFEFTAETMHVM